MPRPGRPLLARDRVRFVGEPVAMVVAETRAVARDALEGVEVSYEPLPAVAGIDDALRGDSGGRIWDGAIDNIAFFWERGDEAKVDEALHRAAVLVAPATRPQPRSFPARWSRGQRSVIQRPRRPLHPLHLEPGRPLDQASSSPAIR